MSLRSIALLALLAGSGGCFTVDAFNLPSTIPKSARPQLPPDTFIEVEAGFVKESYTVTDKVKVCSKGDCMEVLSDRRKHENVRVASASIAGKPLTINEVVSAASPEYVAETARGRGLVSKCRRGKLVQILGVVSMVTSFYLLNDGYGGEEADNKPLIAGGWAALGGGAALYGLGRFAFGGQACGEAEAIHQKWRTVYRDPDATK
ncbi:MAG: hypothetical protein ABI867_33795, partial [Kofleriaceae bacterium]